MTRLRATEITQFKLSLFTDPCVITNLWLLFFCETQRKMFWEVLSVQWKSIGSSFVLDWLSLYRKKSTVETFFKISSFVFCRRQKVVQGWNNMRWVNVNFVTVFVCVCVCVSENSEKENGEIWSKSELFCWFQLFSTCGSDMLAVAKLNSQRSVCSLSLSMTHISQW